MAIIALDTLEYARRLQEAGFTPKQAEAQAGIMAEMFVHNMEALVTRDYLDARLEALEERMNGKFERVDGKFRLLIWSQGLVVAVVLIPALKALLA